MSPARRLAIAWIIPLVLGGLDPSGVVCADEAPGGGPVASGPNFSPFPSAAGGAACDGCSQLAASHAIRPTPQSAAAGSPQGAFGKPSGAANGSTGGASDAGRKGMIDSFGDDLVAGSGSGLRRDATGDYLPPVIGDLGPFLPSPFQVPGATKQQVNPNRLATPNVPGPGDRLLRLAGLKIADNQSPAPQDRVFFSFNYFGNVNAAINRTLKNGIGDVNVYHNMFGFEKTFLGGDASVGIRLPLDHISFRAQTPGVPRSSTSVDDLSVFAKYVLLRSKSNSSFLSTGLNVTAPTGPSGFAGSHLFTTPNPTTIQPFLGYFVDRGKLFLQGFTSVDVPTDRTAATIFFQDLSLGYYAYRDDDPDALLGAIIPVVETHVNVPLNFNGLNVNDARFTPTVVDLTFGTHFQFRGRSLLTVAYATPVTSPRPFDGEFLLFYNFNYGKVRRPVPPPTL